MRTTLTLDRDVAATISQLRKRGNLSLKEIVNQALREGLRHLGRQTPRRKQPFRSRTVPLGALKVGSLDNVAEVLAMAEGEPFR